MANVKRHAQKRPTASAAVGHIARTPFQAGSEGSVGIRSAQTAKHVAARDGTAAKATKPHVPMPSLTDASVKMSIEG